MSNFGPGDVEIQEATLGGAGGSVDIRGRIQTLSAFEDIIKPYVMVTATIQDIGDIINNNVGLTGNNAFSVSFSQPGQDPWKGTGLIVTNVDKVKSSQNQRYATYNITAVSNHMNQAPKVQESYKQKTGSNIIQDLIGSYLSPSKSLRIGDPSKGVLGNDKMPFNLNGVQIWKALRTVMMRSAGTKGRSSTYTLFENKDAMILDTMENLLNSASPVATYYQRPLGTNWLVDQMLQNFIILNLREDSRVDGAATIQDRNVSVKPFDILSNAFKSSGFGSGGGKAASFIQPVYNMMRPALHAIESLPEKKQFAGQMDSAQITMQVPLNPALTVSAAVIIQSLAPPGDTDNIVLDKMSGTHMIVNTRHTIRLTGEKMQGISTVRCVRKISGLAGY